MLEWWPPRTLNALANTCLSRDIWIFTCAGFDGDGRA